MSLIINRLWPFFLATLLALMIPWVALAAEPKRSVSLSTTYPSIIIAKTQPVSLPLTVVNRGEEGEHLQIRISSAPPGWDARLIDKESFPFLEVRSLFVFPGEGKAQTLFFFIAKPPAGIAVGDYDFIVKATSKDGRVEATLTITIGIEEKPVTSGKVRLETAFPDLGGMIGGSFEYIVDITNEGAEDRTVALSAVAPAGWEVTFSPTFEVGKQISAMGLKGGELQSVRVGITPAKDVAAGKHGVTLTAASGDVRGTLELSIALTKPAEDITYRLDMYTETGRLNVQTTSGQESHLSVWVSNSGTGDIGGITLGSVKPEAWVVTYVPPKVELLKPGEGMQLDLAIKPASKTIAGDYEVKLTAFGQERGDAQVSLRVSVATPTTWGWIGIGIVLVVIAAMATLFFRMGRR